MTEHVAVTGAEGFIGSHLTEALVARGLPRPRDGPVQLVRLVGLARHASPTRCETRSRSCSATSATPGRCARCSRTSTSCTTWPPSSRSRTPTWRRASYLDTNAGGTLNVLEAARALGHPAGRAHLHQRGLRHRPHRADHRGPPAPGPVALLGVEGRPRDKLAESYHLSFDLPVVTLRPFNTFGPRQSARAVIPTVIVADRRRRAADHAGCARADPRLQLRGRHRRGLRVRGPRRRRRRGRAGPSTPGPAARSRSATLVGSSATYGHRGGGRARPGSGSARPAPRCMRLVCDGTAAARRDRLEARARPWRRASRRTVDVVPRPRQPRPLPAPTATTSDDRDRRAATVPNRRARYGSERRQRGHRPHRAVHASGDPRGRQGRPAAPVHHPDPQAAGADRRRALDPRDRAAAAGGGRASPRRPSPSVTSASSSGPTSATARSGASRSTTSTRSPARARSARCSPSRTGCPSTSW